jgi:hypothetical protein
LSEGEGLRIVGEFVDYPGMLDALRRRVNELQLNGERFDEYAGLPRGYLSKLVGANPVRRLGMISFAPVLAGLGLRCLFVEDEAATQRLKKRVLPRNSSYARSVASYVTLPRKFMQAIGRKGGLARIANSTARQRSKSARLAIKARFENSTMRQRQAWARKAARVRWRKGAT